VTDTEGVSTTEQGVGERVRVGGQALPDGVLMRTDRAWAIARDDGSVATGTVPSHRWAKIPVVRVLSGLGPALLIGLTGRGSQGEGGTAPIRSRRRPPWPLIRGLIIAQVGVVFADRMVSRARLASAWGPLVTVGLLGLATVIFRLATPTRQWRYHGAEHKAVTAHEQAVDLDNVDEVMACSRIHPRCGTNLLAWMALATAVLGHVPALLQVPATLIALAVIAEIVTLAGRHARSPLARLILVPGEALQRFLTTSEPTPAEQQVGCTALQACLALHERLADVTTLAPVPA
jgi:uncharacterized protein YqhQ